MHRFGYVIYSYKHYLKATAHFQTIKIIFFRNEYSSATKQPNAFNH